MLFITLHIETKDTKKLNFMVMFLKVIFKTFKK